MAVITLKGQKTNTHGDLPKLGEKASDFTFLKSDLSEMKLSDYIGKKVVLNIFPSIDTPVCASSVRQFNEKISGKENIVVLNISVDLPFALGRFCAAEGIENAVTGSLFRSDFLSKYDVEIIDGPLKGLCSRAVIVIDNDQTIVHTEQVGEIADEPNYFEVLKVCGL